MTHVTRGHVWRRAADAAHRAIALAGALAPSAPAVPVLCYHSIDDLGQPMSVPPATFERQMRRLRELGYTAPPPGRLVDDLLAGRAPAPRTVAIVFDDAYRSVAARALPVLADLGFAAGIAVVAGVCDGSVPADAIERGRRADEFLDAGEIRRLADAGVEILSHGMTHVRLPGLSAAALAREVGDSKRRLEDVAGGAVGLFVYPFGAYDDRAVAAAREAGYAGAFTTDPGSVRPGSGAFRLPRSCPRARAGDRYFDALLSPAFDFYVAGRARALAALGPLRRAG